jgi:hypothetical protein
LRGIDSALRFAAPNRVCLWLLLALFALSAAPSASLAAGDEDRIHWTSFAGAQVKLDDKTPLAWNVFVPNKDVQKKHPGWILVLLGRRYLLLDFKAKAVYSVLPTDLQKQGTDFETGDLAQPSRKMPSSDWSVRDVGPMELIRVTLGDYGRVLQVSMPHPPDLRPFY